LTQIGRIFRIPSDYYVGRARERERIQTRTQRTLSHDRRSHDSVGGERERVRERERERVRERERERERESERERERESEREREREREREMRNARNQRTLKSRAYRSSPRLALPGSSSLFPRTDVREEVLRRRNEPAGERTPPPPAPPTSPGEMMERGDDTARSTLWGPSAACTSILYRVCYDPPH